MKLFIDVDNTILEHSNFYSVETESRVHSTIGKYPEDNEIGIKTMYETAICRNPDLVRALFKLDNVYILTKYESYAYEVHKQNKIAQLMNMDLEALVNAKDSNGISKYICLQSDISKVDVVKELFSVDDLSEYFLLDDFSTNLIEWENANGISIKYYNEYNSPNHPMSGISISNFNFFKFMLDKTYVKTLMVATNDQYKLNLFSEIINNHYEFNKIDILQEVYHDLVSKLGIEQVKINNKYDYYKFVVEYYNFQQSINPLYWTKILNDKLYHNNKLSLYYASFDINLKDLKILNSNDSISLKIIDSKKIPSNNIYDVYLTLSDNAFLDDLKANLEKNIDNMAHFILKDN